MPFHQLNFTGFFPYVRHSSHIAVDIQGNDVLKIIQGHSVFYILYYRIPIYFHIEYVVSKDLA